MRIAYNNLFDNYTIAPTTENANYPAVNTQDERLSKYTRTTADATQYWTVDLTSAQAITCAALAAHNLSSGATIQIQASSDNFANTHFTQTITYRSDIPIVFFASQSYRYWRFYIDDAANTDGYLQIGRFYLGTYIQITPSANLDFPIDNIDTSSISFSISNQVYKDIGIQYKSQTYDFPRTTSTYKAYVDTFFATVGIGTPFFFVNSDTDYSIFSPQYVCLEENISFSYPGEGYFTWSMKVREIN